MKRLGPALPWIALALVYLFWGSTYLGIRVAVATIPPYLMTGCRYLIAGVLLFVWQRLVSTGKWTPPTRAQVLRILAIATLLLVFGNGLLCVAETRVESGTAALLLASTPIWMLVLDALRTRKPPSAIAIGGMAVGAGGIAVLVGRSAGHADVLFACITLLAAFSWALGSVYAREEHPHPFSASLEMSAGGVLCILAGLVTGEVSHLNVDRITPASLWGLIWLITGGALVGYNAYAYALRTLPTTTVATYGYVTPVVAVILGAIVLNEPVTWNVLAGGAAVVVSVVLILLGSASPPPEAALLGFASESEKGRP